jgi:DMSO/TMAO reductase YedYZ heme-binding membrane subunit
MKKAQSVDASRKHMGKEWNRLAFHFKLLNIIHLVDQAKEDKE